MDKSTILAEALEALGYDSMESFSKATGLLMTATIGNSYKYISIGHLDLFYRTYAKNSSVYLDNSISSGLFKLKDTLKNLKDKVSYKVRQQRVLSQIKHTITQFIAETFEKPIEQIDNGDITFSSYSRFEFAGKQFFYKGTITRKDFYIDTMATMRYSEMYSIVTAVNELFSKKPTYDS